jgi:hypothetical protein
MSHLYTYHRYQGLFYITNKKIRVRENPIGLSFPPHMEISKPHHIPTGFVEISNFKLIEKSRFGPMQGVVVSMSQA